MRTKGENSGIKKSRPQKQRTLLCNSWITKISKEKSESKSDIPVQTTERKEPMPFPPCFELPNGHVVLKLNKGFAYSRTSKGKKRPVSGLDQQNGKKKRKNTVSQKGSKPRNSKFKKTEKKEEACEKMKKVSVGKRDAEEAGLSFQNSETAQAVYPRVKAEAPTSLARLQFLQKLGTGGYGKVLLAADVSKQKWAVKMVKKRHLEEQDKEAFLIESKVLQIAAGSPFLVRGHFFFETRNHLVYIMDYFCGGTLLTFLEENGTLDSHVASLTAAEIACGLQYLHRHGIVHRDLKLENILLDSGGRVKIADFGLSVIGMFGNKKITGRAGTEGYMAPEMILGGGYDSAIDWWAFGVILYEMIVGEHPFHNGDDIHVLDKAVVYNKPNLPSWLSTDEQDILTQFLSKNPSARHRAAANIRCHPYFKAIERLISMVSHLLSGSTDHPAFHLVKGFMV